MLKFELFMQQTTQKFNHLQVLPMSHFPTNPLKAVSLSLRIHVLRITFLCMAVLFVATPAHAQTVAKDLVVEPITDSPDNAANEAHQQVLEAFQARLPGVPVDSISEGPYPGLYEVITQSQIIYVDEKVQLLFQGEMIDLNSGINLTESRLTGIHMGLINEMGEENMLVYKSEEPSDRSITIFTDINCGYCRRLHAEIRWCKRQIPDVPACRIGK